VLMLIFMGTTLPGAVLTAFFLGRLSDQVGRRAAILFAIGISLISNVLFVFADSIPLLFLARMLSGFAIRLAAGAGTAWVAELCDNRYASRRGGVDFPHVLLSRRLAAGW